jgi:predicted flap endonuclease-1-like 5' DNA nuclease/cytoskeletal protein CcmA (bactofilin family)
MRYTMLLKQNRTWLVMAALVTTLSSLLVFAPSLQAAAPNAPDLPALEQNQLFNDDLTVGGGETIDGDVVVYNGDVRVERDGVIRGNLVVYSGDIKVKRDGVVQGSITSISGDVEIDGRVDGSIAATSGNVKLGGDAVVTGDISVVSGEVQQGRGAVVEGSLLRGPAIQLPPVPAFVPLPGAATAPARQTPTPSEFFLALVGRVLRGLLILGVAVLTAWLLLKWRPALVEEARSLLAERTALAFAVGLIFNLLSLAVIGLLWITVCFRPPAVLLGLLFVAINLVGAVVVGDEIGRRIDARSGGHWPQPWRTVIGVVAPASILVFLWILGSCFGFFAFLGALILTAFGVGAMLVKFLKLGEPAPFGAAATPVASEPVAEAAESRAAIVPAEAAMQPAPESSTAIVLPAATLTADAADAGAEEAAPIVPPSAAPAEADDFTRITGIGPVFDQRLKAAGVRTFAELATYTPGEIAAVIGWPQARVERAEIIEQARQLAQGAG